jgi:hypothetical protein
MPARTVRIGGDTWEVEPAGRITQYDRDEFALVFVRRGTGVDAPREVRVTRYSPQGARVRIASFAELDLKELTRLFHLSQPAETSPEAGYSR